MQILGRRETHTYFEVLVRHGYALVVRKDSRSRPERTAPCRALLFAELRRIDFRTPLNCRSLGFSGARRVKGSNTHFSEIHPCSHFQDGGTCLSVPCGASCRPCGSVESCAERSIGRTRERRWVEGIEGLKASSRTCHRLVDRRSTMRMAHALTQCYWAGEAVLGDAGGLPALARGLPRLVEARIRPSCFDKTGACRQDDVGSTARIANH